MTYIHITGTGAAVPDAILSNHDLARFVDTSDEWITRRTGIKERRVASVERNESTTMLGARAARKALAMAGLQASQIDTIAVGTVTADRQFPSAGCMIQQEIEAVNAAAFDISAGCSGFLYAMESAANRIRAGMARNALVIGVERLSSIVNWKDRNTCVLLGDGAGAVVLQSSAVEGGILSTHLQSDGTFWDLLYADEGNDFLPEELKFIRLRPAHLKMEGNRLFKRAVACLADIADRALRHHQLSSSDIDLIVPHQANIRIIQAMAEKLEVPMDKVFTNVHKYGNTSSASIPIALDEANRQGRIPDQARVLLVSFGAGLTWGAALLHWSTPAGLKPAGTWG